MEQIPSCGIRHHYPGRKRCPTYLLNLPAVAVGGRLTTDLTCSTTVENEIVAAGMEDHCSVFSCNAGHSLEFLVGVV